MNSDPLRSRRLDPQQKLIFRFKLPQSKQNTPVPIQSTFGNPLNLVQITTQNPPVSAQSIEESATQNVDGKEQVMADVLGTSLFPRVLLIRETAKENKEGTLQNSECDISPLLPNLSSMAVNDTFLQDVSKAAETLNSCWTTSRRFYSFLHRSEETDRRAEIPQVIGRETPLDESTPENPPGDPSTSDEIRGPTSGEPPKMVVTRREVLALTGVCFGKNPTDKDQ